MPQRNLKDLEGKLADAVRGYGNVNDEAGQREQDRWLAAVVAALTGLLLDREEAWLRYWWVDSLLVEAIEKTSPLAVDISGDLIWGDERNQWVEPFHGRISLRSQSDVAPSYEFRVGNAATGLQKRSYGTSLRREVTVTDWVFTLRGDHP
jgi:hypothetical protein